ncbi:hypothetical protein KBY96_14090 [Cyanobium sp. ATX 6A2]|uniref:hypothetical protein n=1 Tax=Cyanobium sp. ATX 6A2 TaxID=2823700 RepID=UPI0020CF7C05|nr:hypothetical protein [Cyanobium sp. ATX 6A2]MCP9889053.1 hypothetical protein [Cyanobium sp. ATX 6A2]
MSVDDAYVEVAERALLAAQGAQSNSVHEKAAFMGYHAFESIGGAYCRNRGTRYPKSHPGKVREFVNKSSRERFALQAAELAIAYGSLRNSVLYPAEVNGHVSRPKDAISPVQAVRLIGRTRTLVEKVKKVL